MVTFIMANRITVAGNVDVRQNPTQKLVPERDRERIRELLLERIPLRGKRRRLRLRLFAV